MKPKHPDHKRHVIPLTIIVITGAYVMHGQAPYLFKLCALWAAGIAFWQAVNAAVAMARRLRARAVAELRRRNGRRRYQQSDKVSFKHNNGTSPTEREPVRLTADGFFAYDGPAWTPTPHPKPTSRPTS